MDTQVDKKTFKLFICPPEGSCCVNQLLFCWVRGGRFPLSIYIKPPSSQHLLTKQLLYVSYNLNFTPCFLLIRGPSGAPNLLISMVRGQTVAAPVPHQVLSWSEEWKKKKRGEVEEWEERAKSEAWRKYELSMCCERMENDYFIVIVWCLIQNCKAKLLILPMRWIFDKWNRNRWGEAICQRESRGRSQVIPNKDTTCEHTFKKINK